MGSITPYIGIYIPVAGESNYQQAFEAGMINIDQHDHSGGPNKGVPISSSGLADFSVTYNKLNSNVVNPLTGIGPSGSLPNQLELLGAVRKLFELGVAAGQGFISMNSSVLAARTFQNTSTITWTNANGIAGNPSAALVSPLGVDHGGTGLSSLTEYAILIGGTTPTGNVQQVGSLGNADDVLVSQGAGMPPIFKSLGGDLGQLQTATVSLTAAQFNALNVTRILAVPAPGANKMNLVVAAVAKLNWAASFTTTKNVPLYYGNSIFFTTDFGANAFSPGLGGGASSYWFANPDNAGIAGYPIADIQNADINIGATAASTGGAGSTIDFEIKYVTINL